MSDNTTFRGTRTPVGIRCDERGEETIYFWEDFDLNDSWIQVEVDSKTLKVNKCYILLYTNRMDEHECIHRHEMKAHLEAMDEFEAKVQSFLTNF